MRLVTRSDFDGLMCAILLKEAGIIDSYKFVHPKDVQDGKVAITADDVLTNIPYWPGCGMWFDHHASEFDIKDLFGVDFKGDCRPGKSCARIVYDYIGGSEKYPQFENMIESVDRSDSGDLTSDDVLEPKDWILLSFVMDPRTGLGRYKDYRISNYKLMEDLIDHCRAKPIKEILALPDVEERIDRYYKHQKKFVAMIEKCAKFYKNLVVIDIREIERPPVGNRFVEYAIFLDINISIRVMWGLSKQIVVFACGHSIFNRTSKTEVGRLMKMYGGGGHPMVGTCQIAVERADDVLSDLVEQIMKDG
jgi:oligoribonuclease NrnB/cAMP/cGMP phosphodiesterase (DHH superfamily)